MSDFNIRVTDLATGKVIARYPTYSVASLELKITYPALQNRLRKGSWKTRGLLLERIERYARPNAPLTVHMFDTETSESVYYRSVKEAADVNGIPYKDLLNKLRNNQRLVVIDGKRFYKL